jgi:hypothetical protein
VDLVARCSTGEPCRCNHSMDKLLCCVLLCVQLLPSSTAAIVYAFDMPQPDRVVIS